MDKTVNVIGATGLVGKELIRFLLDDPNVKKIRVFARRFTGLKNQKLEEYIVNFNEPETWEPYLTGDVLYSALGTTLKQAGSKKAQCRVDYTYQYQFAKAASGIGIPTYVLVSSAGANAKSAIFYLRMKGELDEAVQKLPFSTCVILRPSILSGDREKKRIAEEMGNKIMKSVTRYIFRKYRPIEGKIVARAMINSSLYPKKTGVIIAEPDEIFVLAQQEK